MMNDTARYTLATDMLHCWTIAGSTEPFRNLATWVQTCMQTAASPLEAVEGHIESVARSFLLWADVEDVADANDYWYVTRGERFDPRGLVGVTDTEAMVIGEMNEEIAAMLHHAAGLAEAGEPTADTYAEMREYRIARSLLFDSIAERAATKVRQ